MNNCHFTGWIPFAPETRYTPSGRKVICFAVRVRDDHGAESILRFQMDGDPVAPTPPDGVFAPLVQIRRRRGGWRRIAAP